jgi:hypothetical protein
LGVQSAAVARSAVSPVPRRAAARVRARAAAKARGRRNGVGTESSFFCNVINRSLTTYDTTPPVVGPDLGAKLLT